MDIFSIISDPFVEFDFMRRALMGILVMSLGSAPIGVFLVLRRMSLMGDAMSHAILPGIALAYYFFGLNLVALSLGGFAMGVAIALISTWVTNHTEIKEDASFAAFFLLSLALGVVLISQSKSQVDLVHILFGSILALDKNALYTLGICTSLTLTSLAVIYRPMLLSSLDPQFLKTKSKRSNWWHTLFMVLVVINLIAGFQALGTLMAVGLMMLPAIAAKLWSTRIEYILMISILLGWLSGLIGLLFTFYFDFSSGPMIVLVSGVFYVISIIFGTHGGLIKKLFRQTHFET